MVTGSMCSCTCLHLKRMSLDWPYWMLSNGTVSGCVRSFLLSFLDEVRVTQPCVVVLSFSPPEVLMFKTTFVAHVDCMLATAWTKTVPSIPESGMNAGPNEIVIA